MPDGSSVLNLLPVYVASNVTGISVLVPFELSSVMSACTSFLLPSV